MNQKTETASEHTFKHRFKTALKNLGIGIVFLIAGLFLLWHNENSILEREVKLEQAQTVISETQDEDADGKETFPAANENLKATTGWNWGMRLGGWAILFVGLATLFKPLVVMVEKIPLLGNFVGRGITVFALLSSISLTLLLMSSVWMVTRPVYGAILLLIGIVPLVVLYRSGRRARLKQALRRA